MAIRKVVGAVSVTLYEDGQACVEGSMGAEQADLTKHYQFFRALLKAGNDALSNHHLDIGRPKVLVPTR